MVAHYTNCALILLDCSGYLLVNGRCSNLIYERLCLR
jgi:hypothetical protein